MRSINQCFTVCWGRILPACTESWPRPSSGPLRWSESDLIVQHQRLTSLMLSWLNGIKSLLPGPKFLWKVFAEKWRLLQQINTHDFCPVLLTPYLYLALALCVHVNKRYSFLHLHCVFTLIPVISCYNCCSCCCIYLSVFISLCSYWIYLIVFAYTHHYTCTLLCTL